MNSKINHLFISIALISTIIILLGCGGPKIVYTAKVGAGAYPAVSPSEVAVFESTPQKGSYVELGDISIEDELKCDVGKAFGEEKALKLIEEFRKSNPDLAKLSDVTMLELLAERGKIERGDLCDILPRFSRKEEKQNFLITALQGLNITTITQKAGEMGANAVMKVNHDDWTVRGKPSSFGADATQVPAIKVGVKTTAVASHYEPPEGEEIEPEEKEEKVLVVIKDKGKEEEGEKPPKEKKEKTKKTTPTKETAKATAGKAEKEKAKVPASSEKKEVKEKAKVLESEKVMEEAKKKEKELKEAEDALKDKQKKAKNLKTEIEETKDLIKELKKVITKKKLKAQKLKSEEKTKAKEEEKKLAELKKKEEEEKAKALAAAKKEKEAETKKKDEEKEAASSEDIKEAVAETKTKIKNYKSSIFKCLRNADMQGAVKVTFLFKPSGDIDALGFDPDAPESAHKCIMDVLKKETFSKAPRYYKAIFKYTMK